MALYVGSVVYLTVRLIHTVAVWGTVKVRHTHSPYIERHFTWDLNVSADSAEYADKFWKIREQFWNIFLVSVFSSLKEVEFLRFIYLRFLDRVLRTVRICM